MHKGRNYPWLRDLWAVETTWWPYWVGRKMTAIFNQPIVGDYSFITLTDQVSAEGVVSADRKSVRYDLAGEAGVWTAQLFVFNQFPLPPNPTRFNLIISRPGIPNVSNRFDLPTFAGPLTGTWQFADTIPPWYSGAPLPGGCRPALWAEV